MPKKSYLRSNPQKPKHPDRVKERAPSMPTSLSFLFSLIFLYLLFIHPTSLNIVFIVVIFILSGMFQTLMRVVKIEYTLDHIEQSSALTDLRDEIRELKEVIAAREY